MKRALLLAIVLAPGCHIDLDSGFTVNGVRLQEEHEENLEIVAWDSRGLIMELALGDARVESTSGPTRIVATVHERYHGDARLEYKDGELVVETNSGEPGALGDVSIYTSGPIPNLVIATGTGDILVDSVRIDGNLSLSSGLGDISVLHGGSLGDGNFSTGMGDIELVSFDCRHIAASSGMGDVSLNQITSSVAEVATGMGDVSLVASNFDRLTASTGMGDIDAAGTSYGSADLDTGMGSVHTGSRRVE